MDNNKNSNASTSNSSEGTSLKDKSTKSKTSLKDKSTKSKTSLKDKSTKSKTSLKEKSSRGSSSLKEKSSRGGSSLSARSSRSSRRSSRRRKKKKKNQIPMGIIATIVLIGIGLFLNTISSTVALYWVIGIGFGIILQRGRFCFTASMRDPYLTGSTSLTRAVLIAFAITTVGFTAIKYGYFVKGLPIPGMGYVVPISFATIAGAFLFGIGMVIAGGCASGTFMRLGEGFQQQLLVIVFFIAGSLWGAHDFGWWKETFISKGPSIFLPDVFGWMGAVIVQLLFIFMLYYIAEKYEKKRLGN
jgi:uncharacterized membrane protein YedE/YeeE